MEEHRRIYCGDSMAQPACLFSMRPPQMSAQCQLCVCAFGYMRIGRAQEYAAIFVVSAAELAVSRYKCLIKSASDFHFSLRCHTDACQHAGKVCYEHIFACKRNPNEISNNQKNKTTTTTKNCLAKTFLMFFHQCSHHVHHLPPSIYNAIYASTMVHPKPLL